MAGYSLYGWGIGVSPTLGILLLGFALSFVAHEIAHKLTAQNKGLLAEFRIYPLGAVITAITALPIIPIKVIAPGAVRIVGPATTRDMGIIALVGPITNIILAIIFLIARSAIAFYPLRYLASLNAFLAFFNLIPFPPLDGQKVLTWSITTWAITFTLSLALLFITRI